MRIVRHLSAFRAWCKQWPPDWWKSDMLRPDSVGMRGYYYSYARHAYTPPPPTDCKTIHPFGCYPQRENSNGGWRVNGITSSNVTIFVVLASLMLDKIGLDFFNLFRCVSVPYPGRNWRGTIVSIFVVWVFLIMDKIGLDKSSHGVRYLNWYTI